MASAPPGRSIAVLLGREVWEGGADEAEEAVFVNDLGALLQRLVGGGWEVWGRKCGAYGV